MENSKLPETPPKKSKLKLVIFITLIVMLTAAASLGIYFWQHNKVNHLTSKVNTLQTQLRSANKSNSSSNSPQATTSNTFTYSPKTGGLSLTLPKTYAIIVNVDGNKGGAPGATFRVASAEASNTFSDAEYDGVQIDVDNTFSSLSDAATAKELELDGQRPGSSVDRHYKVTDTTVAGLPAKLLTADGLDEYEGNISVYMVGSGSFEYTVTANGTQVGSQSFLQTILNGIKIKSVTL